MKLRIKAFMTACVVLLCITQTPAASPAGDQQANDAVSAFDKDQYALIKTCHYKKDITAWNQWRKEHPATTVLLEGANLKRFMLAGADLRDARLAHAALRGADLTRADLRNADLTQADLRSAKLQGAKLEQADLVKAKLNRADLTKAKLRKANLAGADLQRATLQKTELWAANLVEAVMRDADLTQAILWEADLSQAYLGGTRLYKTELWNADLTNTVMWGADLEWAIFEIKANSLPYIPSIAQARNLSKLVFWTSPHSLVELRETFKQFGLRKQERELTYAIKHTGYLKTFTKGSDSSLLTKIEVLLGRLFFDFTCRWGMAPERPLFLLAALILIFTIPYTMAISGDLYGRKKTNGIWKVWIPERMRDDLGREAPKELLDDLTPNALKTGFYFSLLSAFNIGWRELNVGNWIARIQPYEYRLQASGWARTLSGIQSLISVYLLALSVLTYFGRPFEAY